MSEFMELLPFLLPLTIAEVVLLGYTIYHILTHKNYKRGNRTLWLIVVIVGICTVRYYESCGCKANTMDDGNAI